MKKLKNLIKTNPIILHISSFIYNILYSRLVLSPSNKITVEINNSFCNFRHNILKGLQLHLYTGIKTRLNNCKIVNYGNNNKIIVGSNCNISNTTFWFEDDNNIIHIGDNTYIGGGSLAALEGTIIRIGSNCMLSHSIEIRTSDSHGIMSLNGERINHAKDIIVGENVWIGARVVLLKGANIPKGCIIGHSSICSKKLDTPNAIYAGSPCKLCKENVTWSRER